MASYADLDPAFVPILRRCQSATMTSIERMFAVYKAVEYISAAHIRGDIVECGVWRGGSMMCAAHALLQMGETSRRLYLYDTFEGMVPPDDVDVDISGRAAAPRYTAGQRTEDSSAWCYAPIETVRLNMASTGYPEDQVTYVAGPVEDTIPAVMPESIALLRLDTDWHASTRHELHHLFPRLVKGGVLIIDDYGHWQGCSSCRRRLFRGKRGQGAAQSHRLHRAHRRAVLTLSPGSAARSCG